jgi:hypothetical protein
MDTTSSTQRLTIRELLIPALLGGCMPLALLIFIILLKENVFESWMFFPLLIIPGGGALGGIFFYLMGFRWFPTGNQKLTAIIFSTILYFAAIWISSVAAFALTGHWN